MRKGNSFVTVGRLAVFGLLLASCGPATLPSATSKADVSPAIKPPTVSSITPSAAPEPTPKSATGQPRYGGILIVGSRHAIPHFDMHQETSAGIQIPLSSAYSTLVRNDPLEEDKVIGDLARSWDVSADGLIYTFRLHEGVKFHDGKPLVSEDVKFNLERIIFPPRGMLSPRKELYAAVGKIEAPDPATVKVTLKRPQASFLQLLAIEKNFIFAPHVIKEKGDMKRDVLGTGPFKFAGFDADVAFKLKKNPDYFVRGRPYLDGITIYIILDEMARFAALRTSQVLLLPLVAGPTSAQARELQSSDPKLVAQTRLTPNMTSLIPNAQKEPWSDVRVRRSVNLLMDREAGAKVIRAGSGEPGYGYALPGSPWALPEKDLMALPGFRKPKDQDMAEAKKLIAEAGYPQGFKTTILTSTSMHAKETAEFSRDQLAKGGISATIQVVELAASRDRLFKGNFEVASYADGSSHDEPDLLLNEYYLTGSSKNYGGWSSPKYDELFKTQSITLDPGRRKETIWEMQRVIHQEAPKIVVTWQSYRAIWRDEVQNWTPHRSVKRNHKFQDVWLAKG
ncbi:MAG: hypothetical protein HYX92_21110 [Chloroflexi bacterium]|nr:hypothetical protein [Chloroflexota bacterium]